MRRLLSALIAFGLAASAHAVPGDIAVFFGSFDPLNEGHMAACLGALPDMGVESVLMIPNPDRHAPATEASFEDRLAMVRAAAFRHDEVEAPDPRILKILRNAGRSWKQEVFGMLYQSLPLGSVIQEIVGMSHFNMSLRDGTMPKADEPRMLVVVDRPGHPIDTDLMARKKIAPGKVLFLHPEVLDVDSVRLRKDIAARKDVFGKVPTVVRMVIEHRNLYR